MAQQQQGIPKPVMLFRVTTLRALVNMGKVVPRHIDQGQKAFAAATTTGMTFLAI
jgi:hypothetical protein